MRRCNRLRSGATRAGSNVTDLRWSRARVSGGCGVGIDIRDGGSAELAGDGLQNFASGRIFHGAHGTADLNDVPGAYPDFVADVDDDGVAADVSDDAGVRGMDSGQSCGGIVELRGAIVYGIDSRITENGLGK